MSVPLPTDDVLDAVIKAILERVEQHAARGECSRSALLRRSALILERARIRIEVLAVDAERVEEKRS